MPVLRNRRGKTRWGEDEPGDTPDRPRPRGEKPQSNMGPAVGYCAVATVLAGVVGYGTHPSWAKYSYGLDFILLSRQLQWPFIALSLIATLALLATIIAGRRGAWWLIGLAPVLALFAHRFAMDPTAGMAAIENPTFVAPDAAGAFVDNEDYVVGLTFEGKHYAYPYAALYSTPAVIHAQHDKRVLLMWSAPANRALAVAVGRGVKARDLDVVSTPANALLLYDTAKGVFINGLTGRTTEGQKPAGFLQPVGTSKMPWWKWRVTHPDTQIMAPAGRLAAGAPRRPMRPVYPMPKADLKQPAEAGVAIVGVHRPAAMLSASLGAAPVNLSADESPVLVFRDPLTNVARAFRRKVDDLSPRFKLSRDTSRKDVIFIDTDTNSGWNAAGVAVEGKKEFRGKRLPPVPVEDELYWGVMKHWYPGLQLANLEAGAPPKVMELNGPGGAGAGGAELGEAGARPGGTVSVKPKKTGKPAAPKRRLY